MYGHGTKCICGILFPLIGSCFRMAKLDYSGEEFIINMITVSCWCSRVGTFRNHKGIIVAIIIYNYSCGRQIMYNWNRKKNPGSDAMVYLTTTSYIINTKCLINHWYGKLMNIVSNRSARLDNIVRYNTSNM